MNACRLVTSLDRRQRNAFMAVIFCSAIGHEAKDVDYAGVAESPVEPGAGRAQYPAGLPQA